MTETVVDAGAVLDERDREHDADIAGARGRAMLSGARRPWPIGARTFFVATGLVAAGLVSLLLLKARSARREAEARERESPAATERVQRRVPPLTLPVVTAGFAAT